ncbi:MAG: tRNA (N(6)-L-threonylcarbamoyladenosine(37)-C(2))-methylthiotransferase MtaB [Candidatus Omnitrophica bacterium]|nr:tRNA (N(6)-L-threonylcarbamoyladenosine(37)-C(2))-methylthiotransferase MtaB [Candidatus Omnitrophota bacterium]
MKTFAIKTLGCKVNQYEEQVIRESLLKQGFVEEDPVKAEIFIVNSCTVTEQANVKTRKITRRIKKENPSAKIIVTGCYAVLPEDIEELNALEEVDMVVPGGRKTEIARILMPGIEEKKTCSEEITELREHTRTFLKVQDGCDQKCSYCKVNIVRGRSRSKDEEDVLREVKELSKKSKEIVLTGICLGSWKGDISKDLAGLVSRINRIDGDFRIRLSSIEPNHITEDLIKIISGNRVCPHLHIPLQSGSDMILKAMNRRYDTARFRDIVKRVRDRIPLVGITMDVITGFPGETEEEAENTVRFIKEIGPSRLHVFTYSERKGTAAYSMKNKVPGNIAKERTKVLIELGKVLQIEFCRNFIGKEVKILVEKVSITGQVEGYTGEYLRLKTMESSGKYKKGDIAGFIVKKIDENNSCLMGTAPYY